MVEAVNGVTVTDIDKDGSVSERDRQIMVLAGQLGLSTSQIVAFLKTLSPEKIKGWLDDAIGRSTQGSSTYDAEFVGVMQDPESRNIFLMEMGGDFAKFDAYKATVADVNGAYQTLDDEEGGNHFDNFSTAYFMKRFSAEELTKFKETLGSITTKHPDATLSLILSAAMFDQTKLERLDKALDDHKELTQKYGTAPPFSMFWHDFQGDKAAFEEYLEARKAIMLLDPTLTAEAIDGWMATAIASGRLTSEEIVPAMNNVVDGHEANKSKEGYTVLSALMTEAPSSSDSADDLMEGFVSELRSASSSLEDIKKEMALVKKIKEQAGQLLTMYEKAKSEGSDEDTPEMRQLRQELAENLLRYKGYTEEQINACRSGDGPPDTGIIAACEKEGYILETDRYKGDNKHNDDEWQFNITMITNFAKQFEDTTTQLLSEVQELTKFIEQMYETSGTLTDTISRLVTQQS